MIITSEDFINAMRANVITTSAKVDIIDNKYNNGITCENGNYGIFEGEGIKLDGSICMCSSQYIEENTVFQPTNQFEEIQESWYSTELSDSEGNLNVTYQKVVNNNKKEKSKLHLLFSSIRDEYAVNFEINIDGKAINYTNNTKKEIVIENINSGSVITITITKWSKSNARAKILNLFLGTIFHYEDAEIVSIKGKKGTDLINEEIQSKEIEIKLVDENNNYNIFDENTELTSLDSDAIIIIHFGVLIGNFIYYVKIDECYFKKIEKTDNELEMLITGMGIITKYQDFNWFNLYNEIYMVDWNLKQIINNIDDGYKNLRERILISGEIENENQKIKRCTEKNKKIHEYLNELATNCRCNLIETYDNKILFDRIQNTDIRTIANINIENMEEYPEIEKEDNKFNVTIKKYNYVIDSTYVNVFSGRFTINQFGYAKLYPFQNVDFLNTDMSDYEFVLNIYNADGSLYQENITSANEKHFSIGVLPNLIYFLAWEELTDKIFELTLKCKTLQFSCNDYTINNEFDKEKIIDIRNIQDTNTAKKIGEWLVGNLNNRYKFKIKINDACTYEIGDVVKIETGVYKDDEMIIKTAVIVGIEYEYDGALDFYIILKGA